MGKTVGEFLGETMEHYGKLGMKWGVRNSESRARIRREKKEGKAEAKAAKKAPSVASSRPRLDVKAMSDDELRSVINRLQLERTLSSLQPQEKAPESRMKNMIKDVFFDSVKLGATDAFKTVLSNAIKQRFNTTVGPKEVSKAISDISDSIKPKGSASRVNNDLFSNLKPAWDKSIADQKKTPGVSPLNETAEKFVEKIKDSSEKLPSFDTNNSPTLDLGKYIDDLDKK